MQAEKVIDEARARTGLDEFDSDSFLEPLEILIRGANSRSDYTQSGLERVRDEIVGHLSNRLRVADYWRRHPELEDAPLDVPVVVMGMPRTGTTAVSYLLDCDPRWRSLLNWEAVDSVPPPTTETLRSDPRCVEKKKLQQQMYAAIPSAPPHWEWADGPTECMFVHAQDMKGLIWDARLPSREYAAYLLSCDMKSTYDYQKKVLRILQSQAPGRWALKMPSHSLHFEWALEAFPEAHFIWTHRNPYKALASLGTTIASSHVSLFPEIDREYIHDVYPEQIAEHANRPMRARARLADDKVIDVYCAEFLKDPIVGMQKIYASLGEELTPEVEQRMRAWLDDDTERQAKRPSYALEDWGWTEAEVAPWFEEYLEHYPRAREA